MDQNDVNVLVAIIGLGAAVWVTIQVLKWVLVTLGRAMRAIAPFVLMGLAGLFLLSIFQADAANAATLSVPAGVLIAATRASLIGF